MGLVLSEWSYFLLSKKNVNFTRMYLNMQKYITLQESVAWYNSYTVIEKFQHFKSKNSGKIQWPITIIRVVEEFQLLLSH